MRVPVAAAVFDLGKNELRRGFPFWMAGVGDRGQQPGSYQGFRKDEKKISPVHKQSILRSKKKTKCVERTSLPTKGSRARARVMATQDLSEFRPVAGFRWEPRRLEPG